jgi:NAD(P)-dependent dehydrogenase (short-subunit alcohol dehydrogenase family)
MQRLKGRRIVLTGASRGIGREAVELFCGEGAEIIGIARDAAKLERIQGKFSGFVGLPGDIADKALAARVARAVSERWGALDLLINNAAVQHWNEGFQAEPLEELERHLVINVLSAHWLTHALLAFLVRGNEPRIINVSSGAGKFSALRDEPTMPAYRLSKFALNGMTILHAGDLKGKVAVNALDPGWLKTDLGGPKAPGEPRDGAVRMLDLALKPFEETGKFWYGAEAIDF